MCKILQICTTSRILQAKFLKFVIPGASNFFSICVFHAMLVLTSLISVLGIRWIAEEKETEPEIGMLQLDENPEETPAPSEQENTEA